jgi:hypothetical protein
VVTPGQRTRLARAKRRRRVEELPDDFESLSGSDQLAWLISNGTTLAELLSDENEDEPQAEACLVGDPKHFGKPEPEPVMIAPPSDAKPMLARLEPPAEPLPPPSPPQWWEERCQWQARGPNDYYDDEPKEEEDDEGDW